MSRRNERLYHVFYGMKARCYNKKNPRYNIYGGKRISICDEWMEDYDNFKSWSLKNGYREDISLSIDRIDSNGNYEPSNCQWISLSENSAKANKNQHKNKSKKYIMLAISPNGYITEIKNISKFCRHNNLSRPSVSHRLNGVNNSPFRGWEFYSKQ